MTATPDGHRRMLVVLAHPDDESFGPGATLAKYATNGVEVHYLCGTRGDVGSTDSEFMQGYGSVAEMRWAELECAARELKLAGIHHLGFRDSGMPGSDDNHHPNALSAQPVAEVAARIAHYIRKLKPQVVMTHDPIGGYRHPDHIMLHKATVMAFHAAADSDVFPDPEGLPPHQPAKLYYPIFSRGFLKFIVRVLPLLGQDPKRFGRNKDIDLTSFIDVEFPIHAQVEVSGEPSEMRKRASQCHRSQMAGGPPRRGVMGIIARLAGFSAPRDGFMRAHPPAADGLKETDLFAGL